MTLNSKVSDEGVGNKSSDYMAFSGEGLLLQSTDIPSQLIVVMSAFITVIPKLTEGRMGRGVS